MQSQRHYSLFRRLLFPFSGEEVLTFKQALRVLAAWALLVPGGMAVLVLIISLIFSFPLSRTIALILIAFLSGVFVFGLTGLVVIGTNNRAARIRQEWLARRNRSQTVDRGGRYGS